MKRLFTYSFKPQLQYKLKLRNIIKNNIFPFSNSADQSSLDLEKIDFQQKEKILKELNDNFEFEKVVKVYRVLEYANKTDDDISRLTEIYNQSILNLNNLEKEKIHLFENTKWKQRLVLILKDYKLFTKKGNFLIFLILSILLFNLFAIVLLQYQFSFISDLLKSFKFDKSSGTTDSPKSKSSTSLESDIFNALRGNSFHIQLEKNLKTSLADVKGIDEVKEEIEQLIRIIKDPIKYKDAGAKIPKGVLLVGKPGTGKTLIAKAIAGDSKVNFISMTGSDFEDMFVGSGSDRIKKLFNYAREKKPCIIFIDEIDALLAKSKRSTNEHSSSRSTINQFLSEMDGFHKYEEVFVIGATNHESDLDSAAVRPGRFDKKIHINVPDSKGREDIAELYLNKITLPKESKVTKEMISQMTTGFSGAEIENLINLTAVSAVNQNKKILDLNILTEARDRILMGISRKYFTDINKRRYMTSVHEIGHTLTCYNSPLCKESLLKVTIIPSGPALGVTQRLDVEDTIQNKEYLLSFIDMAMGGHVAEKIVFGEENVTAGCSSDLSKATEIARKMVMELGMYGEEVGYLFVEKPDQPREERLGDMQKNEINKKVNQILSESHDRVKENLTKNGDKLIKLSQALFRYNTLDIEEIEYVLQNKDNLIKRPIARDWYSEINRFDRS